MLITCSHSLSYLCFVYLSIRKLLYVFTYMSKYCVLIILPVLIHVCDTILYNSHFISVLKKINTHVDSLGQLSSWYQARVLVLGLAFVLMLRPFFPEHVISADLLSFEHPSILLFCSFFRCNMVESRPSRLRRTVAHKSNNRNSILYNQTRLII